MRKRFVKVVRDKVGNFASNEVTYEKSENREEWIEGLRRKLVEEALEYLQNPSVGELADVFEVVSALATEDLEEDLVRIVMEAHFKRNERGGFVNRIAMFVGTTAPVTFEGEHVR